MPSLAELQSIYDRLDFKSEVEVYRRLPSGSATNFDVDNPITVGAELRNIDAKSEAWFSGAEWEGERRIIAVWPHTTNQTLTITVGKYGDVIVDEDGQYWIARTKRIDLAGARWKIGVTLGIGDELD